MTPDLVERRAATKVEVRGMRVVFGGVVALDSVDLTLARGEILGVIGPNGAGKTTLVNAMSGFQAPTAGEVILGDADVTGWAPSKLARAGVVRTFQGVRSFGRLSVLENVEAGSVGIGMRRRAAQRIAWDLLTRFNLEPHAESRADSLPYGEERRLGIARALAADPDFLLLDEPGAGLNEDETDELSALVADLRRDLACGVLVIDHDMRLIMGLCDRLCVLDHGRVLRVGTPEQVRQDVNVVTAYLGTR
jgi:branched-chain amino acid transport system ATP-binding protein